MKLTTRQNAILSILVTYANQFIPAKKIADSMEISVRTVKSELQTIREICHSASSFGIETSPRKGSKLVIYNKSLFEKELKCLSDKPVNKIDNAQKRNSAIINYLLNSSDYVSKSRLMSSFFIADTTLYNQMKQVKKILSEFSLSLEYKSNAGYIILGKEINKRTCLNKTGIADKMNSYPIYENTTGIYNIVADIFIKFQYRIDEQVLQNLTAHIARSIERIKKNHFIEKQSDVDFYDSTEFKISKEILNTLLIGYRMNDEKLSDEAILLTQIILGKVNTISNDPLHEEVNRFIDESFTAIYQKFAINFDSADNLRLLLVLHLIPLLYRAQSGTQLNNPLESEIHQSFPQAYDVALYFSTLINKQFSVNISVGEVSYLALYFNYGIDDYLLSSSEKKILIITSLRKSETILLRHKILNWFPNQIEAIDFIAPAKFFPDLTIQNYDGIFTTEKRLPQNQGAITFINLFPSEKDFEKINLAINGYNNIKNITDKFSEECYFYGDLASKNQALDIAIENAQRKYPLSDDFSSSIYGREQLNSTYFGNKIAIPHTLSPISEETFVSFVALEKEIAWDNLNQVKFIILVSIAKNNPKEFQFWHHLSTFLQDQESFAKFAEKPEFKQLIQAIEISLRGKFD